MGGKKAEKDHKVFAISRNYGFIPQTYGADGDPLDVVDLDENIEEGSIKKIKIIGGLYFEDKKTVDIKFIGLDPEGTFKNIETIQDLVLNKFASLEILKIWFESYKKIWEDDFFRLIDRDESIKIIEDSHESINKSVIGPKQIRLQYHLIKII